MKITGLLLPSLFFAGVAFAADSDEDANDVGYVASPYDAPEAEDLYLVTGDETFVAPPEDRRGIYYFLYPANDYVVEEETDEGSDEDIDEQENHLIKRSADPHYARRHYARTHPVTTAAYRGARVGASRGKRAAEPHYARRHYARTHPVTTAAYRGARVGASRGRRSADPNYHRRHHHGNPVTRKVGTAAYVGARAGSSRWRRSAEPHNVPEAKDLNLVTGDETFVASPEDERGLYYVLYPANDYLVEEGMVEDDSQDQGSHLTKRSAEPHYARRHYARTHPVSTAAYLGARRGKRSADPHRRRPIVRRPVTRVATAAYLGARAGSSSNYYYYYG